MEYFIILCAYFKKWEHRIPRSTCLHSHQEVANNRKWLHDEEEDVIYSPRKIAILNSNPHSFSQVLLIEVLECTQTTQWCIVSENGSHYAIILCLAYRGMGMVWEEC